VGNFHEPFPDNVDTVAGIIFTEYARARREDPFLGDIAQGLEALSGPIPEKDRRSPNLSC
jgi:hypothetical protein